MTNGKKMRASTHTVFSLLAGGAIALTAVVAVDRSPVAAQSAKQKDALLQFQKSRDEPQCKVLSAGYIFPFTTEVFVEASCPGKPEPIVATSPKGRDEAILNVALSAIGFGKPVYIRANENGVIVWLVIANPK